MEPSDFGRYRKAVIGTSAIGFVLAASSAQEMSWAGITLTGTWVWIFLGIAHSYFMLMLWVCFGMRVQTSQHISTTTAYSDAHKREVDKLFTYKVPFALGLFGGANIALQLFLILYGTVGPGN